MGKTEAILRHGAALTARGMILIASVAALVLLPSAIPVPAAPLPEPSYEAVAGLIDTRSTFSDGAHSIEEIVQIAQSRGFRVLFINDHDRISLSYGLPPFRNLLRYRKEHPSIMTHGPEAFLAEIDRVARKHPRMVLIPGCETSPFYYWTGSWFQGDLTANDYDRRILILNFRNKEDYSAIPNLGNRFSLTYTLSLIPGLLVYIPPLLIGLILLRWRGWARWSGLCLVLLSILALADYNPFRSCLFSPYGKDPGIAPYQEVIDYAEARGGLTFWNYPEQRSGIREHGPIRVHTAPYPEVLLESRGYTGFAAIYGDWITATDPGREWDRALKEYCRGERNRAPWGVSTADFHEDGRLGIKLGAFPTTFLVKEISAEGVLEAARRGRMYCSRGDGEDWLRLEAFHVSGGEDGKAVMGEVLHTTRPPLVTFRVSYQRDAKRPVGILLIRGGDLIHAFQSQTPMAVEYLDRAAPEGETTYYRVMDTRKHLTSNPIFVQYRPNLQE
ncbi:MAG: hypothetical protein JW821_10530 [Deltaproteobacteria bacterium]|nr:hypothetical protein [Deltaproteobacteria bacterium]